MLLHHITIPVSLRSSFGSHNVPPSSKIFSFSLFNTILGKFPLSCCSDNPTRFLSGGGGVEDPFGLDEHRIDIMVNMLMFWNNHIRIP